MTFGNTWHDSDVKDKQMRAFTTLSQCTCLAEFLFYTKSERLGQMVEMHSSRILSTVALPRQVDRSLHQPLPEERYSRQDS